MVSFGSRVHAAVPTPQIGNATANVVIVEETARIPSRSSCIVSTTIQNGDALSGRVGILEPHDNIPWLPEVKILSARLMSLLFR